MSAVVGTYDRTMTTEPQNWTREGLRQRDNTGSTARDHLANERTYLAWLRTGFGTTALGIGVAKLLGVPGDWKPILAGVLFLVLGIVMLLYGTLRYFRIVRALDEGMMHVGRTGPIVFGFVATVIAIAVAILVLV